MASASLALIVNQSIMQDRSIDEWFRSRVTGARDSPSHLSGAGPPFDEKHVGWFFSKELVISSIELALSAISRLLEVYPDSVAIFTFVLSSSRTEDVQPPATMLSLIDRSTCPPLIVALESNQEPLYWNSRMPSRRFTDMNVGLFPSLMRPNLDVSMTFQVTELNKNEIYDDESDVDLDGHGVFVYLRYVKSLSENKLKSPECV
jgi:hypothetical protein